MNYVGDFVDDATVYIPFNTFDSNDPSASVTITNLAAGDVEVWKNGVVQTTPGAGVTLTLNIGANNGSHLIAVDTSNTTDVGWFATGNDYQVRINGTTVDGATINAWVGSFSIENRFMRGTDSAALATVLGAAVGASISADIADLPTVAEFEARTIVSADYVVVGDTIARVTLTDTATTVTGGATEAKQDTAQSDLDTITGTGGVLIGTDVMDRSGTLDINTKTITANAITATAINADAITNAKIADDAIAAENLATGAIAADAVGATALDNIVVSDLAGMPTSTAKIVDVISILLMALRNKATATSSAQTIGNDAGATIATAVLSDVAGTTTKEEFA